MGHAVLMTAQPVRADRTLIAILTLIAVIAVVAIAVVFTRGGTADIDAASPEGVVQAYSRAVVANDYPTARELLSTEVRERCDPTVPSVIQDLRMTVVSSKVDDDTVVMQVRMSYGGGTFGGAGYDYDAVFTLVDERNAWTVESVPWEFALCLDQGLGE